MGKEKVFKTICLIEAIVIIGLGSLLIFNYTNKEEDNVHDNKPNNNVVDNNNENDDESNIEDDEIIDNNENNPTNTGDSFVIDNETGKPIGKVVVKGYAYTEVIDRSDALPGAKPFTRVYFRVVETDNQEFVNYIDEHRQNSFFGEKSIVIGCLENKQIVRGFHSDATGFVGDIRMDREVSETILNTSKDKLVTLKLTFTKSTSATEVYYEGFSFVTNISLHQ